MNVFLYNLSNMRHPMKIKIGYVGYLDIDNVTNNSWLEISEPISISQLLNNLDFPSNKQKFIVPTINSETVKLSYKLQDKDELFLYLPVGGG